MDRHQHQSAGYDWLHFVVRSGREGRDWAAAYGEHRPLVRRVDEALALLRRRRLDAGEASLDRVAGELAELDAHGGLDPSIRDVLERWLQGTLGYARYCRDDHDAAEAAMQRAHAAVARAIGRRRFLLPLASHCHEFCLHQARIARNRRRWDEMFARIEEARRMIEDERPLCELVTEGRAEAVLMSTLRAYFSGLGELAGEERRALDFFFDDGLRRRQFDRFVRRLCALPGFAIPCP